MTWNKAFVAGWIAILSTLIIYEMYAAAHGHDDPTLTDVVSRYLPWWVIMPFLSWLWMHFFLQYKYPNFLVRIFRG